MEPAGRQALERFYVEEFLPHVPGDLVLSTVSTLVGQLGIVTGRAASGLAR